MRADPVVLCGHLPDEGYFHSERHQVIPFVCDDGFGYWRGLTDHWDGPETLVNVEHDLEISDRELDEITECPHPLCSWSYAMHWVSTGAVADTWPHTAGGKFVTEGAEWAEWSAIGFVKIAPEARIAPLEKVLWRQVEDAIDKAVAKPWHLHWPAVPHHHW